LLQFAGIGIAVHVICSVALRFNVNTDGDVFEQMFTKPFLGSLTGAPRQLRAKYFFPWVSSPEHLDEESLWVRTLFWGARLGGTAIAFGVVGFLSVMVYMGMSGQP
jgi:hypothetical protein